MQDANEDTQWNDVLRQKGIIPQKEEPEVTEEDVINILEAAVIKQQQGKTYDEMDLDELDSNEDLVDEDDERAFLEYRRQRLEEMKTKQSKAVYGDVTEISKQDYVSQVNEAGEGVWVVLHVYKQDIPMCKMINTYIYELAQMHPATKFLRSRAAVCIPNYPDHNIPTIFIYHNGSMIKQFIGVAECGGTNLKRNELEWNLSQVGALVTEQEENPKQKVRDMMTSNIRGHDSDSSDDGY